jgi:hypothetical protein
MDFTAPEGRAFMGSEGDGWMGGNAKKLLIVAVIAAAGYGAYRWYARGLKGKTNDELFEMVSRGGTMAGAATVEIELRAGTPRCGADALAAHLGDASPSARIAALKGLRIARDKSCAGAVIRSLKDDHAGVRENAARVFETVRVKESVPPLIALLQDPEEPVRVAASSALRSTTKQAFSNKEPERWKLWWDGARHSFDVPPE